MMRVAARAKAASPQPLRRLAGDIVRMQRRRGYIPILALPPRKRTESATSRSLSRRLRVDEGIRPPFSLAVSSDHRPAPSSERDKLGSTITRSATAILMAGALAFAAATPTSAAGGHGGGGGGGGGAFVGGGGHGGGGFVGGGAHAGGFGGGFQSAPAGGFHAGPGFSGSGVAAGSHPVNPGFLPGQIHGVPGGAYAYQHGHRRNYGYGGYYGYGNGGYYDGNPYCTPYWLSVNPNLCYSGS